MQHAAVRTTLAGFAISKGVACAGGALYFAASNGKQRHAAPHTRKYASFQLFNFNLISKVFQDGRRGRGWSEKVVKLDEKS